MTTDIKGYLIDARAALRVNHEHGCTEERINQSIPQFEAEDIL